MSRLERTTAMIALLAAMPALAAPSQPVLGSRSAQMLTVDGLRFRDLDRNGKLDPYEDWRLSAERRADDLVGRMTLKEKAGEMMHGTLAGLGSATAQAIGNGSVGYDLAAARTTILDKAVTSLITRLAASPKVLAEQNNAVQAIAEEARLGVPVTISTDPRNHFQFVAGASVASSGFSKWPETLGFAALRDPKLTRHFADIARGEYRAVGIHMALSPQADVASEPRWSRITGTFGSDPLLDRAMVQAYVTGFQGGDTGLKAEGVMTIVKHWVGYGAEPDGFDGHSYYGRIARIGDAALKQHLIPFEGAFAAKVSGVMPTYVILSDVTFDGHRIEQVGAGYNRDLLTGLLRGRYKFGGIILSDWNITRDCNAECRNPSGAQAVGGGGMPWGVEDMSIPDRIVKGVVAGLDQFGGVAETDLIVDAVRQGKLTEQRVTESARRVLIPKFQMGLFENPYVDPAAAATLVGAAASEGLRAQAEAQVLLRNEKRLLPLKPGTRVYLHGVAADAARADGLVPVDDIATAEVALIRTSTPSEIVHPRFAFGGRQHEGRLNFQDSDPDYEAIKAAAAKIPVVLSIFLDRPAILTEVIDKTGAILANFGASDRAVLDVVTGKVRPNGRLPFELPSSMEAVDQQDPARSDDSIHPLFPIGAGLGLADTEY